MTKLLKKQVNMNDDIYNSINKPGKTEYIGYKF